ncbi:hypothetical protein AVEN_93964-1 [Araneus ventricosus]|uniref:Uncharacterized protein n=1 Tax=Araneus ventricosus TaxID=182803 RepID=A0A4Y2CJP3_ARAVE|nr:hypothetical protein AVEN_93964-1 [Araneus ventricosus]
MWATNHSRVPVDGAAIASDVRESSCREQKKKRRRHGTRSMNDVGFSLTMTRDDDVPSKSLFNDDLLQLYISLAVNNAPKCKLNPDNITI